jgi:hypothetical protein
MGTLRSQYDHSGMMVNGITLGEPAWDTDENGERVKGSDYRWDDSALPNGSIDWGGEITIDTDDDDPIDEVSE